MKILAMAAHPDDVELLCAGTLAHLVRAGHEVAVCHMTVGDKGGTGDPAELARTREAEARASCELLGARYVPGFTGDLELYANADHRERMLATIREVGPDVILTHAPNDYHPDHRTTGQTVVGAYEGALDAVESVAGLGDAEVWYMDNLGGVDLVPDVFVDITDVIETKQAMLRCHASQISWMTQVRHTDMEYVTDWVSRWRGLQAGFERAEGYLRRRGDGSRLAEALGRQLVTTAGDDREDVA